MDVEFDRIYSNQIQVFRAMQTPNFNIRNFPESETVMRARQTAVGMVEKAITSALEALGRRAIVRSDALLFLMVNLTEIVAVPLLSDTRNRDQNAVQETLTSDATTIVGMAREFMEADNEVSAAAILFATAKVLPNLKLKNWRLWDRP